MFTRAIASPTTVIHVKPNDYDNRIILRRESGLLLYSPGDSQNTNTFDIIYPLPISVTTENGYSLFRSQSKIEVEDVFDGFTSTIPYIYQLSKKTSVESLQEVCDIMRKNVTWSIAHLAVQLNKTAFFQHPNVISHINDISESGLTPIMIALQNSNLAMVNELIKLNCSLNHLSNDGNTVLHYAAVKDNNILSLLLKNDNASQWLNKSNDEGHTPLLISCKNNHIENIKTFINNGAIIDGNNSISPLHICTSQEAIEIFASVTLDVNKQNSAGETPLHIMVKNNNYDCVINLLKQFANPSLYDINYDSPLHLAVNNLNLDIVKALVAFGANVNAVNKKGETPRHKIDLNKNDSAKILSTLHAVGALRCLPNVQGCQDSCKNGGNNDGPSSSILLDVKQNPLEHILNVVAMEKSSNENRKNSFGRILCLDGGGVRGLVLIQILKELEYLAGKPIIKCFDWVAGTSTGGILAMALASGKTLDECQLLYFILKDKVFEGERPYSAEKVETVFKEYFGNLRLSDIKSPKLLITSVVTNECPLRLKLMRNFLSPTSILENRGVGNLIEDFPLWEVARMTSAAPTYFSPFGFYMDGGLIANNPTLDALTEVLEYGLALRSIGADQDSLPQSSIVVSCGTGIIPTTKVTTEIYSVLATKRSEISLINGIMKIVSLAKTIGTILTELITSTDGRFVDRARAWCCMAGIPYYRFSPPLSSDVSLDETSNRIIVHTIWETKAYMHENKILAKEIVHFLLRDDS